MLSGIILRLHHHNPAHTPKVPPLVLLLSSCPCCCCCCLVCLPLLLRYISFCVPRSVPCRSELFPGQICGDDGPSWEGKNIGACPQGYDGIRRWAKARGLFGGSKNTTSTEDKEGEFRWAGGLAFTWVGRAAAYPLSCL